jgi:hypothetical protein
MDTCYKQQANISLLTEFNSNYINDFFQNLSGYTGTYSTYTGYIIPDNSNIKIDFPDPIVQETNSWILIKTAQESLSEETYVKYVTDLHNIYESLNNPNYVDLHNVTSPTYTYIPQNLYKVKFSCQNDNFNDIINQTFEFSFIIVDDGSTDEDQDYRFCPLPLNPSSITSYQDVISSAFYMFILINTTLEDDRYLLLTVPEIDTMYQYSTDQTIQTSFSVLFPDYVNGDYYYLDTVNHEKVYDHGTLGNLTKMTIIFKNSSGTPITTNYNINIIDYDIKTPNNECICTTDFETGQRIRDYQCFHSYLRHPSFEKLQNTLVLKLGILEGIQDMQHI